MEKVYEAPSLFETREDTMLRNKLLLKIGFTTGLRLSEITNLTREDIDTENMQIQVKGKGGKIRPVFLTEEIRDLALQYKKCREKDTIVVNDARKEKGETKSRVTVRPLKVKYVTDNVFIAHAEWCYGKKISDKAIQEIFQKYKKLLAIEKPLTCHKLRHSFCTHLMENSVDYYQIMAMA
jgi:site-specific recombinase XerD